MTQRQEANKQIATELLKLIDKHPDMRFAQILFCFGFIRNDGDAYNIESSLTLTRVQNAVGAHIK